MSKKAENRWVRLLGRAAAGRETNRHTSEMLDRFNSVQPDVDAITPFMGGVIRVDSRGQFWFLNKESSGWASNGYCYTRLSDLMRRWRIVLTEVGSDAFSVCFRYAVRGA